MNAMSEILFESNLQYLESNLKTLSDKPEDTIESTLMSIWMVAYGQAMTPHKVLSMNKTDLPDLNDTQLQLFKQKINERLAGVPLSYIIGIQEFMGIEFIVNEKALIPRKETEILGYAALEKVNAAVKQNNSALVVDVCTGCGNLALAIAYHQPEIKLYAMDLSEEAISLAKDNQRYVGIDDRVEFFAGDLLDPVKHLNIQEQVDIIVCNPPYITSGKLKDMPDEIIKFEPEIAFNGGALGVKIINRICQESLGFLKPGGWLVFELGLGQGEAILKRQQKKGLYNGYYSTNDQNGNVRVIMLQK